MKKEPDAPTGEDALQWVKDSMEAEMRKILASCKQTTLSNAGLDELERSTDALKRVTYMIKLATKELLQRLTPEQQAEFKRQDDESRPYLRLRSD